MVAIPVFGCVLVQRPYGLLPFLFSDRCSGSTLIGMVAIPVLGSVFWRNTYRDDGHSCSRICVLVRHSKGRLPFLFSDRY
eukprot:9498237-Pyramimonas_sp.AAC.1